MLARVGEGVRVGPRRGGERSARALQRGGGRGGEAFAGHLPEVLERRLEEDVPDAHLHERVRALGRHPGRGRDAVPRRLQRQPRAGRVPAPRARPQGVARERVAPFPYARALPHARHERPAVEERQHLGVDDLALFLARRGVDEGSVQQRPRGRVGERAGVDVLEEDRVHRPEPVQRGVRLHGVVLEPVAGVGDGEGKVTRLHSPHGVHHRVAPALRAPPAREKQRPPPGRVPHALDHLPDPPQEPLVVPRPRGTPEGEVAEADERLPGVGERRGFVIAHRHHQLAQRSADVGGGPDEGAQRAVGRPRREGDAASLDRLAREHRVRHQVDERGRLPDGAGEGADGGAAEGAHEAGALERAHEPALVRRETPRVVRVVRVVRGGAGVARDDAGAGASGGGLAHLRDGLGERGDPGVHRRGGLRLEHERGLALPRVGLEHEHAPARERAAVEAVVVQGRVRVEDADVRVGADARLPAGGRAVKVRVAGVVAQRRAVQPGGGAGEDEEAAVPLLTAAERVRVRLLREPSGEDHLLARGGRGGHRAKDGERGDL